MTGPRLHLDLPTPTPLDECLVGTVTLEAGSEPVTVNGRLDLHEGDLEVRVTQPGGRTVPLGWPWPVDSGPRSVTLPPGHRIVTGLPVFLAATGEPAVAEPGRYVLQASYDLGEGRVVESGPVPVDRVPAADHQQAAALSDRDVLRSLLSASVLGDARPRLERIAAGSAAAARVLARLALGSPPAAGDQPARSGPDERRLAAAVTAVLPAGLFPEDERVATVLGAAVPADGVASAMLRGEPMPD